MQIDTTALPSLADADWLTLLAAVQAEQSRRDTIATYATGQQAAQAAMQAAIAANTAAATPYTTSTVYQPGAAVTTGGVVYWWPGPGTITNDNPASSTHWVRLPGPGETATPWTVGMALTTGLLVSNGGHQYRWAQAAVASAPANYAPTGTVSTASWTFVS